MLLCWLSDLISSFSYIIYNLTTKVLYLGLKICDNYIQLTPSFFFVMVISITTTMSEIMVLDKSEKKVMDTKASHLNYSDKINNGSFYTPPRFVDYVWELINPFLDQNSIVLDTSAGKGSFFLVKGGGVWNSLLPITTNWQSIT